MRKEWGLQCVTGPGEVCVCVCVCVCTVYACVPWRSVCDVCVLYYMCLVYACTPQGSVYVLHVCMCIPGKYVCVYCVTCVPYMHVHPGEVCVWCVCVLCYMCLCYMCPVYAYTPQGSVCYMYACASQGSVCVLCMHVHPREVCVCVSCVRTFSSLCFSLDMCLNVKSLSHVQLFVTPWTVAYQAPLSMEFSRQEYWSGLPFPSLNMNMCLNVNPCVSMCF